MKDLIDYINDTYEEYPAGKFGTAKVWHVTSKLTMVSIVEIGKAREESLNPFKVGDDIFMWKVFYAVLKPLDTMSEVLSLDCRDCPIESTELVDFLFFNTLIKAVKNLEAQVLNLTDSVKHMSKDVTYASKVA